MCTSTNPMGPEVQRLLYALSALTSIGLQFFIKTRCAFFWLCTKIHEVIDQKNTISDVDIKAQNFIGLFIMLHGFLSFRNFR